MIDFHSHFLPRIDDGAEDIEMSIEMLTQSLEAGVDTIVSTSHCYPETEEKAESFIKRRDSRVCEVEEYAEKNGIRIPKIIPAAEVNLLTDISEYSNLDRLCIAGTNYILLELPWGDWHRDIADRVYNIAIKGYRPIMAHIERFGYQSKELLEEIYSLNVLFQINSDNIGDKKMRKHIRDLWERGLVHVMGSDMHHPKRRPQTMNRGADEVSRYFSAEHLEYLWRNGDAVLKNEPVDTGAYRKLPKATLKTRFFG